MCAVAGGKRVEEAETLSIHLVGARIAEVRHLVGWEIIALRYRHYSGFGLELVIMLTATV